MPCVIKYEYDDGVLLKKWEQELWCGKKRGNLHWCFTDAQHAALADKPVCNKCKAAIKKVLDNKE